MALGINKYFVLPYQGEKIMTYRMEGVDVCCGGKSVAKSARNYCDNLSHFFFGCPVAGKFFPNKNPTDYLSQ